MKVESTLGIILINIIIMTSLGYGENLEIQKFVKKGDSVTLECIVTKASPPVVTWRDTVFTYDGTIEIFKVDRDGSKRNEDHPQKDNFVLNPSTLALEIKNIEENFVGNFICDSVVGGESHSVYYFLAVYKPIECKGNGTFNEGENQQFSCEISFSGREPSLTMQLGDGTSLENEYKKDTDIDFVVITLDRHLTSSDDGETLVCKAKLDDVTEECRINIGVKHSTKNVSITPSGGEINVGDKVICTGDGNPKPKVAIHKDGEKKVVGFTMVVGEGSAFLEVPKEWVNQVVDIHCLAENRPSSPVSKRITLKVGESVSSATTEVPGKFITVLNVLLMAIIVNIILH